MREPDAIHYYWRPGCGFCASLRRQLDRHGIDVIAHDIWAEPGAAGHVRSVTGGDETVPTVTVGDESLVNPSITEVVELVRATAPDLLPDGYEPPPPSNLDRVLGRLFGD